MVLTGGTDRAIRLWNLADSSQCTHVVSPIAKSKNVHISFKSVPVLGGGRDMGKLGGTWGSWEGHGEVGRGVSVVVLLSIRPFLKSSIYTFLILVSDLTACCGLLFELALWIISVEDWIKEVFINYGMG